MNCTIALIGGDGIGPEVIAPAVETLKAIEKKFAHNFDFVPLEAGGAAYDKHGDPLPEGTLEKAKQCGALLLGAVGGPKWDNLPGDKRPEHALLALRKGLGVFANLRPASLSPQLRGACPLKDTADFDLLIVRELTGGLYFGERGRSADGNSAFDTETYSAAEIERVLRVGYEAARLRQKKVTVVDKANVLETSRLWREVTKRVMGDYADVATDFLYVDNAAMQLVRSPRQFDVIVTSNLFGDILSDEASVLTGSIGMLPSASLGAAGASAGGMASPDAVPSANAAAALRFGMYEPIHGSAPDIAGKDIANPLGTILSAAMMLRYSFGLETEAAAIEAAVSAVLDKGLRTTDIYKSAADSNGEKLCGTKEMGAAVISALASS